MKKRYKALMLDLDGTTIPNKINGVPSENVIKAVKLANKKLHVGIATARPLYMAHEILGILSLSGPSIISGGSQLVDYPSKKIIWDKPILENDFRTIKKISQALGVRFTSDMSLLAADASIEKTPKIYQLYFGQLPERVVDEIMDKLSSIPTIAHHKIVSWRPGLFDVVVTHAIATKQHGILEVAKVLGIETHEIIGVGDGYNDFPLLMACGLKVAMGNAVPELKEIADYIAPTVDEDGVANVIEKFVL